MVPSASDPNKIWESFDCFRECKKDNSPHLSVRERANRGCTRKDLLPIEWDIVPNRLGRYLGNYADPELEGKKYGSIPIDWRHPFEDMSEGCPGGWYRSNFVDSIWPYLRRRTDNGDRVENRRYNEADDKLILDACEYWEQEDERCRNYVHQVQIEAEIKKQKEARKKNARF